MMLARADTVSATIVPLETGWCHVMLTAETGKARSEFVGGGAAFAGAGAVGAGLMVVLGALLPVALLPVPVGLGIGYAVARQYRTTLARIQLGLERALDQLEHGAAAVERQLPRRRRAAGNAGGGDPAVAAVGERSRARHPPPRHPERSEGPCRRIPEHARSRTVDKLLAALG